MMSTDKFVKPPMKADYKVSSIDDTNISDVLHFL